jgi:hypothetical protein
MARVGPLAGVDIDALWAALRPRIIALGRAGGGAGVPGAAGAAGETGPQGPPGPKGVTWRGEWTEQTDYTLGDIVTLETEPGVDPAEHPGGSVLTYLCLEDHTSLAGSPPAPGGTIQWHEITPGYLVVDGSRPMTGDLEMGGHEVDDVLNLHISGGAGDGDIDGVRDITFDSDEGEGNIDGVRDISFAGVIGEGVIDAPRVIHMSGDHADDEAKVDGLERVVFNDEPTASSIELPSRIEMNPGVEAGVDYTAGVGKVSWDTLEDTLVVCVASGAGVVFVAFGWGVLAAVNGA